MDQGFPVKVYIYDISKGMARSLSYSFLGRQLDGIWHTGVVVHGQEFYFGSMGIECCSPCGTMLGQPDKISDLGSTQVPPDVFMDYLSELATSTFRPECYHLFNHNCNTFSNEVAQFLTGKCIPSEITNLPAEVLSTPFGAMIKPLIDSMSVRPPGGQSILSASASPTVAPPAAKKTETPSKTSNCAHTETKTTAQEIFTSTPDPIVYPDKEVLSCFSKLKTDLSKDLSVNEQSLLDEIFQYMVDANCQWSLSKFHISLLGDIIRGSTVSTPNRSTCSTILQLLVLKPGVLPVLSHDNSHTITKLLAAFKSLDYSIKLPILKMLANCTSLLPGHKLITSEEAVSLDEPVTNSHLISDICVSGLLDEDSDTMLITNSLVYNLSMFQISDDLVVELSSAILQSLVDQKLEPAAFYGQCSLLKFMDANNQVASLAALLVSDWERIKTLSPRVASVCDKVRDRST